MVFNKKKYNDEYYLKNKERILQRQRDSYQQNKDKRSQWGRTRRNRLKDDPDFIAARNKNTNEWRINNREQIMLQEARNRARRKNIPFSITRDNITIPEQCPVLNIPLFYTPKKRTDNTPSLERIYPEKGYTPDNIIVISWRANKIRNVATFEELKQIARFYAQFD